MTGLYRFSSMGVGGLMQEQEVAGQGWGQGGKRASVILEVNQAE